MNAGQSVMARFVLAVGGVLVVLGSIPVIVGPDRLDWIAPLDALFHSSAVGGALILAALGHLTCSALLASRERGRLATVHVLVVWVVLISVLQQVVLLAASATRLVDSLAPDESISGEVWAAVSTFRWNFWVADHVLDVPAELLGLTLFSIAVQLIALLTVAVLLVPRRWSSTLLAIAAALAVLVVVLLRWRAVDFQDPYLLSLDTFARSDAFFVGVLVACVSRRGWRLGPSWSSASALLVVGAVLATSFVSITQHLAVQLPATALIAGLMMLDDGSEGGDWILRPVVGSREVEALASSWAPLVAVAPLAAAVIGRRTEVNWILRVVVLLLVLAIVLRVSRAVAVRVRLPERTISVADWGETWRRVVADADADITSGRRGKHARDPESDDGRPPAD
ncbi:hypothetical protein [Nocardioides sp. zg-1230]|uniref:hypothetical protein n=1 Tax=Nocardioides sp. zg-1230 TaxID=2736601 RepID=UPI00155193B6|nr:hypothetical protein [Nocardioides sp. zg-1230]NPC44303.1 hypothetical protein [Nocardioides sp. zg-1230]